MQPIAARSPSDSEGYRSLLRCHWSSGLVEVKVFMYSCLPNERPAQRACLDDELASQTKSLHKQCHQPTSFESSNTYTTSTFHSTHYHYHPSTTFNINTANMAISTKLSAIMLLLVTIFGVLSLGAAIPASTDLVST